MSVAKRLEPNTAYQTQRGVVVLTDPDGWIIEFEALGDTFSFDTELTRLRAREAVLVKAAQNTVNNFGHYERRGLGSYSPMVGTIDTDKIAELADALATLDVPDPKEQR